MKVKIRKGDTVIILSGREADKGRRGEVIKVIPEENRVVVAGVNLRKKHQREVQTQGRSLKPGLIEFEAPISIANVMLICPKCNQPSRVGVERKDGESQRICKNCGKAID
ncbi:MAG: 50S ribosomal protein L24 [Anaerolineales bacterium]|nr:50S ribosomal protein L24 [Anaerolineales bacterium]